MYRLKISDVLAVAIILTKICAVVVSGISVTFDPPVVNELLVDGETNVTVSLEGQQIEEPADDFISIRSEAESVAGASFVPGSWNCGVSICNGTVKVIGRFLGFAEVFILHRDSILLNGSRKFSEWKKLSPPLEVIVKREDKLINKLFTIFVATVVTINYINFGCALELDVVKEVLRRPIGPAVGFVCQFLIMPVVSYGVGYLLFSDPVLRLGLFTFGCSPGGGASNMWTVLLGGNLNLSITMTFISTIAAFLTLPIWLFTLGQSILQDTNIVIPWANIFASLVCLVIPIVIGLLIQRFLPKVAARSKRFLAPICIILLVAIIVLAAIANTYIFFMLSWKMVIAASLSVWSGFLAGILVSVAFGFSYSDIVAVSIETGIQNSGIAFVLLSYSLAKPVSDMAAVVPVAGSMITPIPLFIVFCFMKIRSCWFKSDKMELQTLHSKKDEYQSTKNVFEDGPAAEMSGKFE